LRFTSRYACTQPSSTATPDAAPDIDQDGRCTVFCRALGSATKGTPADTCKPSPDASRVGWRGRTRDEVERAASQARACVGSCVRCKWITHDLGPSFDVLSSSAVGRPLLKLVRRRCKLLAMRAACAGAQLVPSGLRLQPPREDADVRASVQQAQPASPSLRQATVKTPAQMRMI
jgi:hypothetical protein